MNKIAFFGGLVLILLGLCIWFFRPSKTAHRNSVRAFGMEFDFTTPEFIIMAFGLLLMLLSPKFPSHLTLGTDTPNYITVTKSIYESQWRPNKVNGYNYAARECNGKTSCSFVCKDSAANYGDPDKGAPKRCKIDYFCANEPGKYYHFDEGNSDTAVYKIQCP
jgi:hypothetical protein